MAELTEDLKREIVLRLARYDGPAEIVVWLREEHETTVSIYQVTRYDPTRPAFEAGDKWRAIFDEARKLYVTDVASQPIASQGFRMGELGRLYRKAVKSGNTVLAASLLEQAAKEVGGIYSNVRHVTMPGRDGGDLTPDERQRSLAELINRTLGRPAGPALVTGPATPQ